MSRLRPSVLPVVIILTLFLSGCGGGRDVELQSDQSGSDEMKRSPCACLEVPYQAPGYAWGRG